MAFFYLSDLAAIMPRTGSIYEVFSLLCCTIRELYRFFPMTLPMVAAAFTCVGFVVWV